MKFKLSIVILLLSASFVFAIKHNVSIGGEYNFFTKSIPQKETMLSQLYLPWKYVVSTEKVIGFMSTGFSSSTPYKIDGDPYWGSRNMLSDSRIGFMMPFLKNKLIGSLSYLMPTASDNASQSIYELNAVEATAAAFADQDFQFSQTRIKDGSKTNLSIAYANKYKNQVFNFGVGYFFNEKYDNINPGDFALLNAGINSPLPNSLAMRNDITFTYNFPAYSTVKLIQGNSISYSLVLTKKISDERNLKINTGATIYTRNTINDALENENSNRNSIGLETSYDLNSLGQWNLAPKIGLSQYVSNGYDTSDANYLPSQTRGELGIDAEHSISSSLLLKAGTSLYAGNNGLFGVSVKAVIDFKR